MSLWGSDVGGIDKVVRMVYVIGGGLFGEVEGIEGCRVQ